MDGACKGAFPMIKHDMPLVQCFLCPSHGLDKFIQNALSHSVTIRMQANAMSNVEFTTSLLLSGSRSCSKTRFTEMEACLHRQNPDTQQKFNKVSNVILSQTDFWKDLDLCCQIFEPSLEVFRVSNGMKGGTPAILYNMCLGLDKLYSEPIDGLDESIRYKVHALFMARWNTFHAPVHSSCFLMD